MPLEFPLVYEINLTDASGALCTSHSLSEEAGMKRYTHPLWGGSDAAAKHKLEERKDIVAISASGTTTTRVNCVAKTRSRFACFLSPEVTVLQGALSSILISFASRKHVWNSHSMQIDSKVSVRRDRSDRGAIDSIAVCLPFSARARTYLHVMPVCQLSVFVL